MIENNTSKSIAVLPFVNMSSESQTEYFCDGITEEIIHALSKIDGLKVISRTSSFFFKNHKTTLEEIAEKLQVSTILEGSVKVAGDTFRIKAQLIDATANAHYWSETWDRKKKDLFHVQDEISLLIADKLREHDGHLEISDHLVKSPTENLEAYEHFLRGRYHFTKWNAEDSQLAIEHFEMAVILDNRLIEGHLGLADCYSFMAVAGFAPREVAWKKAQEAIQHAKNIDPNHAGLNYLLANQAFFTEADFNKAMTYGQNSLSAKPTYSEAHQFVSFLHTLTGDFKKANDHLLFAKSTDPLNPETRFFEANYNYRAGNLIKSKNILEELLLENDKNLPALIVKIYILIKEKRLQEAQSTIDNVPQEALTPDERLGLLGLIDATNGINSSNAINTLKEHGLDDNAHHAHSYLFMIYAILGENEQAFDILEKLFEAKSSILLLGFSDPLSELIRPDERYQQFFSSVYPIEESRIIKKTKPKELDESVAKAQVKRISEYVSSERPYLNPSLSLRLLADQVDIHPNQLSWLLNEFVGKNFNEFINHERIAHFKLLVVDPSNSHISIIGLAYESGFNSKTVFNTAFKKEVGMTPKEFQNSQS